MKGYLPVGVRISGISPLGLCKIGGLGGEEGA